MKNTSKTKPLDPADIHAYRKQHSEPLVTDFFRWVYQQRQRTDLLPKSPFAKALHYAHERESQLKVFLGNPALPMDTNHLEWALRVIPMGRNYLFCWSELGAEQLGILQSLMVTCRLQGVNPYHYLVDVLQRGITSGQGRNRPHAAALETKIQSKQVSQRCQNTHQH